MTTSLNCFRNLVVDALKRDESLPELMSDDMYREKMRQQWEEEEQRSMEQPETHYANVQFNGIFCCVYFE
jgi:hypothetical protein